MSRYEVTSDRLFAKRGDVVDLDPAAVNVAALIAAGHIRPAKAPRGSRGDVHAR